MQTPGTATQANDLLEPLAPRRRLSDWRLWAVIVPIVPVAFWVSSRWLAGFGIDWYQVFYPAVRLLLEGKDPYVVPQLHNPAWVLFPLVPFVLLGPHWGLIAYSAFKLFSFIYVAYRFKANPLTMAFFVLSPMVISALNVANVDCIVIWGFLLPPTLGLFFLALKPQLGIAVAALWAYEAWKRGGPRRLAVTFAPVIVALALTFLIYGNWLATSTPIEYEIASGWNASLVPWSIPLGLYLFYLAAARGRRRLSVSASPLLSPYMNLASWSIGLMGFVDDAAALVPVVLAMWSLVAISLPR